MRNLIQASLVARFKSEEAAKQVIENEGELRKREERLLALERIILQTISFDLSISHPYRFVFQLVKGLSQVPDELVQSAWIVVNDSYRTTLCIRFPPKQIALAALCLAAERRGLDLSQLYSTKQDPIDSSDPAIKGERLLVDFDLILANMVEILHLLRDLYGQHRSEDPDANANVNADASDNVDAGASDNVNAGASDNGSVTSDAPQTQPSAQDGVP